MPLVLMPLIVRGTREPRIARDRLQEHGMLGAVPRAYVRSVACSACSAA
jgi:hypothetical protein